MTASVGDQQAAQQQRTHDREDAVRAAAPPQEHSSPPRAELKAAAGEAARVGDAGMSEGRFRDPDCFIPDQKASRYEDKGFAVNQEEDALASAVLDLQQDDAVSSCLLLLRGSYKSRLPRLLGCCHAECVPSQLGGMLSAYSGMLPSRRLVWRRSKGATIGMPGSGSMSRCSQTRRSKPGRGGPKVAARCSSRRTASIQSGSSTARCGCRGQGKPWTPQGLSTCPNGRMSANHTSKCVARFPELVSLLSAPLIVPYGNATLCQSATGSRGVEEVGRIH